MVVHSENVISTAAIAIQFTCHNRQHSDPSVPRAMVAITIIFSHYAEQHTVEIAIIYFRKFNIDGSKRRSR